MSGQAMRLHEAPPEPMASAELSARIERLSDSQLMTAVALLGDRRGQPPIAEPAAPAILHIDLAEVVTRAPSAPGRKPTPLDAMEWQLLEAAKACAAGDERQRPSRELIAVALREVEREQAFRDDAETDALLLRKQLNDGRQLRHDTFQLFYELVRFIAAEHGLKPTGTAVMQYVREHSRATTGPATPATTED